MGPFFGLDVGGTIALKLKSYGPKKKEASSKHHVIFHITVHKSGCAMYFFSLLQYWALYSSPTQKMDTCLSHNLEQVVHLTHTQLVPGSKHIWCKNPLVFAMIVS